MNMRLQRMGIIIPVKEYEVKVQNKEDIQQILNTRVFNIN